MLDDLAAAVENVGPRRQALRHAIERVLVFDAGDRADAVRASCAQRAVVAGFGVAVVDLLEIAQPAMAERLQRLPSGADVGVAPSVVAELVLAEKKPLLTDDPR